MTEYLTNNNSPRNKAEEQEARERSWAQVETWHLGFGNISREEAKAKAEECLLCIADLCAILDSTNVQRVIEQGYPYVLHRYANVMQMFALSAHSLLDRRDWFEASEKEVSK